MDPFLVLLHSVSAGLSSSDLTQLKFLCQNHISKRKLELAQSGLDLFTVLLQQNELNAEHTALLRELLCSLRRKDLLLRLDDFERGAAGGAAPEDRGGGEGRGPGAGVRARGVGAGPRRRSGVGPKDGERRRRRGARGAWGPCGGWRGQLSIFQAPSLFRVRFPWVFPKQPRETGTCPLCGQENQSSEKLT